MPRADPLFLELLLKYWIIPVCAVWRMGNEQQEQSHQKLELWTGDSVPVTGRNVRRFRILYMGVRNWLPGKSLKQETRVLQTFKAAICVKKLRCVLSCGSNGLCNLSFCSFQNPKVVFRIPKKKDLLGGFIFNLSCAVFFLRRRPLRWNVKLTTHTKNTSSCFTSFSHSNVPFTVVNGWGWMI